MSMRRIAIAVLALMLVMSGCGGHGGRKAGDDESAIADRTPKPRSMVIVKSDVKVGTLWSAKVCGLRLLGKGRTELVPNSLPALSPDAPHEGDIVPSSPTAVAVCPTSFEFPGGLPIEITGHSLRSLTSTVNAEGSWDSQAGCATTEGWQRFFVFKYLDDRTLAVLVDGSGCGAVDSGAQQRFNYWADSWNSALDRLTR